jgi:hypothetical protein
LQRWPPTGGTGARAERRAPAARRVWRRPPSEREGHAGLREAAGVRVEVCGCRAVGRRDEGWGRRRPLRPAGGPERRFEFEHGWRRRGAWWIRGNWWAGDHILAVFFSPNDWLSWDLSVSTPPRQLARSKKIWHCPKELSTILPKKFWRVVHHNFGAKYVGILFQAY